MKENNLRFERIQRLLRELKYEVTRGMMEREVSENLCYQFTVPISNEIRNGVVFCEFLTRPMLLGQVPGFDEPSLRIIK